MAETMVISPKIMKNVCINAHPTGCIKLVQSQIEYVKQQIQNAQIKDNNAPKNVLIIGGSAGYGLASRIVAAFGYRAKTLSVAFETPSNIAKKRTATVGWYNTHAFETEAKKEGLWCKSIYGDAFSNDIKQQCINIIQQEMGGKIDLLIYSLASPKRIDPFTGKTYNSVLKPIGSNFNGKSINVVDASLYNIDVAPASKEEIAHTVKVMGGEDWKLWIDNLIEAKVFADNSFNIAFSYIGPELTKELYRNGTIGKAKEDLEATAHSLDAAMQSAGLGRAYVSVNKALVTRASSVIPVVPLYLAILYKVMKAEGTHEACIEQMYRLFSTRVYGSEGDINIGVRTDEHQRIRMDDWEMHEDIQKKVADIWEQVNETNLELKTDIQGFRNEFYNIHGFMWNSVDYSQAVEI